MTLRMIQPIGNMPVTMPRIVARVARPVGMPKATVATRKAMTRARMAAICALTLPLAIIPSRAMTGSEAMKVESHWFPNGS